MVQPSIFWQSQHGTWAIIGLFQVTSVQKTICVDHWKTMELEAERLNNIRPAAWRTSRKKSEGRPTQDHRNQQEEAADHNLTTRPKTRSVWRRAQHFLGMRKAQRGRRAGSLHPTMSSTLTFYWTTWHTDVCLTSPQCSCLYVFQHLLISFFISSYINNEHENNYIHNIIT